MTVLFDENPLNTDVNYVYPPGTNTFYLSSTTGMSVGDVIEIMQDNGEFFRTSISAIPQFGEIITTTPLPSRATINNIVLDLNPQIASGSVVPVLATQTNAILELQGGGVIAL